MGIRGAVKNGGGGFLNNVDVEWKGYEFTTTPPSKDYEFGSDREDGEWVYLVPQLRVDGAEGDVNQHFFVGGADRYSISDDGKELSHEDGSPVTIGGNTPAGVLLTSILEADPSIEADFPDVEAGEALTFSAMNGRRGRVKQVVDENGNSKRGKRKVKGKDGKTKEYDRTNTVFIAIYPAAASAGTKAKGGAAATGKAAKATKAAGNDELRDKADGVVVALCEKAVTKANPTGRIPTSKLSVGTIRELQGDKQKDAVRKLVTDVAYLADAAERGVFAYDADEETVEIGA